MSTLSEFVAQSSKCDSKAYRRCVNTVYFPFFPSLFFIGIASVLTELNLSHNRLVSIPASFGGLTSLTALDLTGNDIRFPPVEVIEGGIERIVRFCRNMAEAITTGVMNLCGFGLLNVPREIWGMTSVTDLQLDSNVLDLIDEAVGQLIGLRSLSLRSNKVSTLPPSIVACTRLERIILLGNPIEELPLELHKLTSLTEIHSDSHDLGGATREEIIDNTFRLLDSFENMSAGCTVEDI